MRSLPGAPGPTRVAMPNKMTRYWATKTALLNKIVGKQVGARLVVTWSRDLEDAWVNGTHSAVGLLLDTLVEEQETAKKGLLGAPARLKMKKIKKKEERDCMKREKIARVFGLPPPKPEKKVDKKKVVKKAVVKKAKATSTPTSIRSWRQGHEGGDWGHGVSQGGISWGTRTWRDGSGTWEQPPGG